MPKDDLILLIFAFILVAAMLLTLFFRGGESRHGVGFLPPAQPDETAITPLT